MGLFKKSYFEKQQLYILNLIREPLLLLVLMHLPHLQYKQSDQDDLWELIAINLNNHNFGLLLLENEELDELPTFNGHYVREEFEKHMALFVRAIPMDNPIIGVQISNGSDDISTARFRPRRENYTEPYKQILCELHYLRSQRFQIMAKISSERLEALLRKSADIDFYGADLAADPEKTSAAVLDRAREKLYMDRLRRLEDELEKKNARIDQMANENKKLLELNHALVGGGGQVDN